MVWPLTLATVVVVIGTGVEVDVGVVDDADLMYEHHVHNQQRALSGSTRAISHGLGMRGIGC